MQQSQWFSVYWKRSDLLRIPTDVYLLFMQISTKTAPEIKQIQYFIVFRITKIFFLL